MSTKRAATMTLSFVRSAQSFCSLTSRMLRFINGLYSLMIWSFSASICIEPCTFLNPGMTRKHLQSPCELQVCRRFLPTKKRIKEYRKSHFTALYFWPWSLSETLAVVSKEGYPAPNRDEDEVRKRYAKFGGRLRNILRGDPTIEETFIAATAGVTFKALTSLALNVDQENSSGETLSGFVVCYDNRGNKKSWDLSKKNLEYTSLEMKGALAEKLQLDSMEDQMKGVLSRLDGERTDLSGKVLENVSIELLSRGTDYSWRSCEVGGSEWVRFRANQRTSLRVYQSSEHLTQQDLITAPTRTTFPVIDLVFSLPSVDTSRPVVAFQCTWKKKHFITVRTLYDLRCNLMRIPDTQMLSICLISPEKEAHYLSKSKRHFLSGSPNVDLKWSKNEDPIPARRLQTLWRNTTIHVFEPDESWQSTIKGWLGRNPRNT